MGRLDRLREEGAQRLAEVEREKQLERDAQARERSAEEHARLRLAVGRHRYRRVRGVVFWLALPGLPVFAIAMLTMALEVVEEVPFALIAGSLAWLFGLLWLWSSELVWRASAGSMQAEEAWIRSRPFVLRGAFEWLAEHASKKTTLRLEIRSSALATRAEDVRTMVAALYPRVSTEQPARIDGVVRLRLEDVLAHDDDDRLRVLHDVVDGVLVPLHHEAPIESVTVVVG